MRKRRFRKRHSGKPEWQKKIAKERIRILLKKAEENLNRPERTRRYVEMARKIGLRYRVRLGPLKRKICKDCNTYLKPGVTARIRLRNGTRVITCLNCGKMKRIPYLKRTKAGE